MKISIKDGWFQIVRGYRVLFAIHPSRRVIWRNLRGTKYTAIDFPWQKQEQPK